MLENTWIIIYVIFARTAAEDYVATSKPQQTERKGSSFKHDASTLQKLAPKAESGSTKLTFKTLYPQFMLTWSTLNLGEQQSRISQTRLKSSRIPQNAEKNQRNTLSTNRMKRADNQTTKKMRSINKAFIEVKTMRPFVPKRIATSKNHSREFKYQSKRSENSAMGQFKIKKHTRNSLAGLSTTRSIVTHLHMQPVTSSQSRNGPNKQNKIFSSVSTSSYLLQRMNSVKRIESQDNLLNQPKKLEKDLKNSTQLVNFLKAEREEKEEKLAKIMAKSLKNAKSAGVYMKAVDNLNARKNSHMKNNNIIQNKTKLAVTDHHTASRQNIATEKNINKHGVGKDITNKAVNNDNSDFTKNVEDEKVRNISLDRLRKTQKKKHGFTLTNSPTIMDKKWVDTHEIEKTKNLNHITRDPLAYDSFDLQLEHESNMREYFELKNNHPSVAVESLPAIKTFEGGYNNARRMGSNEAVNIAEKSPTTINEEPKIDFPTSYNDDHRSTTVLFAPMPGYNTTNFNANNNKYDQETFDEVLEKINNFPFENPMKVKNVFAPDSTEALGKRMLERFDSVLSSTIDDRMSNRELQHFNHVKYVDSVMRQNSLPLYQRRNIVMKSLNQQINELYKSHNLKPKEFSNDNLDTVFKVMGETT